MQRTLVRPIGLITVGLIGLTVSTLTAQTGADEWTPQRGSFQPDGHLEGIAPVPVRRLPISVSGLPANLESDLREDSNALQSGLFEGLVFDRSEDRLWAMGADYKASLGWHGFEFIPFLGSDAPKNYPLRMNLHSVTLGSKQIPITRQGTPRQEQSRWILNHGPAEVWYDLSPEGVKQSVSLNAAGSYQDLTVEFETQCDLEFASNGAELTWSNAQGGIRYQEALVIDGAGKELAIPIAADGSRISLVVPGSFLSRAVDPILVDPLISSFTVAPSSTYDQHSPDVSYDTTTGRYAYVLARDFSVGDRDIRLVATDQSGNQIGTTWLDISSDHWDQPAIANDSASNIFLVAAVRRMTGGGAIWGRSIDAASLSLSPTFQIGNVSINNWSNSNPDVGGKAQGSSRFKVVWQRSFSASGTAGIRSASVTPIVPHSITVAPSVGGLEIITSSAIQDFYGPAISKSTGYASYDEWNLAYMALDTSDGSRAVERLTYDNSGTPLMANFGFWGYASVNIPISVDVSDAASAIVSDSGNPLWIAAICWDSPATGGSRLTLKEVNGSFIATSAEVAIRESVQDTQNEWTSASIATMRSEFLVTYAERDKNTGASQLFQSHIKRTNTDRLAIADSRIALGGTDDLMGSKTASASGYSAGSVFSRNVASAYGRLEQGAWSVQGRHSTLNAVNTPGFQYCSSISNSTGRGGMMLAFGTPSSLTSIQLRAEHMPLNQFGHFVCSQGGFGTVPVGNGNLCLDGGAIGRYNRANEIFFTGSSGIGELTILSFQYRTPTGDITPLAGQTWNFQAWHRENGGQSNFTNALSILLE